MVVVKNENKIRPYEIQRRVFKDSFWFRGWFKDLKPEWSEWSTLMSFEDLKKSHEVQNIFEKKKIFLKYKVEYRLIKNG